MDAFENFLKMKFMSRTKDLQLDKEKNVLKKEFLIIVTINIAFTFFNNFLKIIVIVCFFTKLRILLRWNFFENFE